MADNKTDALVPKALQGMISTERPAGSDAGQLGNEGITREDVALPRLGIAQKMSHELDPTNTDRYIEGLQFTDLYNSLTKERYGKGPLFFSVIRRYDPRYVEFFPIEDGGGVKDMNVPPGDPRTQFTTGEDGQRVKPLATMFYDYLILLLNEKTLEDPAQNVIGLSLKSSGIKAAKKLNMLIQQRGQKLICKGVYKVTTGHTTDKKSGTTYAVYNIDNAGWLASGSALEKLAVEMFESWKDREANIDRGEDPEDFNPAAYEATAAAPDM